MQDSCLDYFPCNEINVEFVSSRLAHLPVLSLLLSDRRSSSSVSLARQLASSRGVMNAKAAINKEVFVPHDEKMLAAVMVKRRTKKKIPFLATGGQGDYMTFICLSGQKFPSLLLLVFAVTLARVSSHAFQHFPLDSPPPP